MGNSLKSNTKCYIRDDDDKKHTFNIDTFKGYDKEAKAAGHGRQKIIEKLFNKPELKKYKSRYIKLNAGDAVIFHNYLFHGTLPNLNKKKWLRQG